MERLNGKVLTIRRLLAATTCAVAAWQVAPAWASTDPAAASPTATTASAAGGQMDPTSAEASRTLRAIIDRVWTDDLADNPVYASALGKPGYEGRVGDYSLAGQRRQAERAARELAALRAIDPSTLSPADRIDQAIMIRELNDRVEADRFGQRTINFSNRGGWHLSFAGMADNLPFRTTADFKSYVDRLARYRQVHDQAIAVANEAVKGRYTLPCTSLDGFERTIDNLILDPADDAAIRASRWYAPFRAARPTAVDQASFDAEAARARRVIAEVIQPALREHRTWYAGTYKPACQKVDGVSAQPGGAAYYQHRIGVMTTTDLTADAIHRIGLSEVARIRAEMEAVAKRAGFTTREAFIDHLRTDPRYYAKTPEELMREVARVTKDIDGKMPALFGRLPRLPYGLKEIPAATAEGDTTAYYNPGSPDVGIAGFYFVNTSKLDQRPLWEVPALSVHEAVPGHHHQIALQQELDIPEFRRFGVSFTAFTEGWGLYSERLGIEMGLYDTPAKDMGRLSYEMWRATRLVVDTGIHAKGWDKTRAVRFMLDNTALSPANIDAEVNRYIAWPGQALAYKLGELKIRELRTLAERQLGSRFSLPRFHDAVLAEGAVPLDLLEAQVKAWIASEQARPAS